MMHRKFLLVVVLVALASALFVPAAPSRVSAAGAIYYVDGTAGNDTTGSGSSSSPWKTIAKCATVAAAGDTCRIKTGTYREAVVPSHTGTAGNMITFEPASGATVTVSGADVVSSAAWSVSSGSVYRATATLGMGEWRNQVFVDGQMMNLARWPNTPVGNELNPTLSVVTPSPTPTPSATPTPSVTPSPTEIPTSMLTPPPSDGDDSEQTAVIQDTALTQSTGFWNGAAVWVLGPYSWGPGGADVASYTHDGTKSTLNLEHLKMLDGLPGIDGRYYLSGKLGALDYPGEWYYDSSGTKLYLQTPANDNPSGHVVEYKARDNCFDLSARSYIKVKGLNLFACTIQVGGSYNEIDGINAKYVFHQERDFVIDFSQGMLTSEKAGIVLGGDHNTLRNSTVAYSAGSLVTLFGTSNSIVNNELHEGNYGPQTFNSLLGGITMNGQQHLISHNTIYHTARAAISGRMYKNVIQYNDLYETNMLGNDGGAIYVALYDGGNSEIHHNRIHDVQANTPNMAAGIYIDSPYKNVLIHHNLIYNIGTNNPEGTGMSAIYLNGPTDFAQVYNNTTYAPSSFWSSSFTKPEGYGSRYVNNIAVDKFDNSKSNAADVSNNLLSGDPKFVDPAHGDFTLQATSPAIDFGKPVANITTGYTGNAPDQGAFEYGVPAWTAGRNFASPPNPTYSLTTTEFANLLTATDGSFDAPQARLAELNPNIYLANGSLYGWTKTYDQTGFGFVDKLTTKAEEYYAHDYLGVGARLGAGEDGLEQTITGLEPNTTYELKGYGHVVTTDQKVRIGIKGTYSGNHYMEFDATTFAGKTLAFNTGPGETSATVYVYKPTTGGYAYVDDISLMKKTFEPSHAGTIVDEMADFTKMYSHTGNLYSRGYNPEWFGDDDTRLIRFPDPTNESFVYRTPEDLASFTLEMYVDVDPAYSDEGLLFYASVDGDHYTPVAAQREDLGGFLKKIRYSASSFPNGARFLKIAFDGGHSYYYPEITRITIDYRNDYGRVVDTLDDLNKLYSHTSSVILDTYGPSYFGGDASRLYRSSFTDENIVWKAPFGEINDFKLDTYNWPSAPGDRLTLSTSLDGVTYTPFTPTVTTDGSDWMHVVYSSTEVPAGAVYLKVSWAGCCTTQLWTPQIGGIDFGYGRTTSHLTDPLDDFTRMDSHSANLAFDQSLPLLGDASRLYRTTMADESFVYKAQWGQMSSFNVTTFAYPSASGDRLRFFTSPDGTTYTAFSPTVTVTPGFFDTVAYSSSSLPSGTKYLKIGWGSCCTTALWTPQISQVDIDYGKPAAGDKTLIDDMADTSNIYLYKNSLYVDTTSPSGFGGDAARLIRTTKAEEYIVYRTPGDITSATIDLWVGSTFAPETLNLYASADNVSYQPVTATLTTTSGAFNHVRYAVASLPANTGYLKVEWNANGNHEVWSPQIGNVEIHYE